MLAIGNTLSNSVYEATIRNDLSKPVANSSREEKEKWIRCKYEAKDFLPESNRSVPNGQQLVEAVVRAPIMWSQIGWNIVAATSIRAIPIDGIVWQVRHEQKT